MERNNISRDNDFQHSNFRNEDVARMLESIANMLEIKGDSPFRIRAYREAAHHSGGMTENITELAARGKLREMPGVGESIAAKIEEYLKTGHIKYYEELKSEIAPGLGDLLDIPTLGPRRAETIYRALGITTISALAEAARQHKLHSLPGIAEKTEQRILREIERLEQRTKRLSLGVAWPAADEVAQQLRRNPAVQRVDPAGSVRRRKETIGDIDILVASRKPEEVMRAFVSLPQVQEVLLHGPTKSSVLTRSNLQIDVRVIRPEEYGSALQYFTGSKQHNIALRELAIRKGLKLNEYGIFDIRTGKRLAGETEEEIYQLLGLQWMPPELRENRGEIEAAADHRLPKLIQPGDLRGDLHVHTDFTDGVDSLETMIEAARRLGYEYIAITDHSVGLGVARGLTLERIAEQGRMIAQLNRKYAPFRILHGTEVNIRGDGRLDYDDEVLAQFDIVTASVHTGFGQPREKMTERIIRAIHNPYVHVLNHPTGRLIGRRAAYDVDLEAVLQAARETGTAVEINSQPSRLDLDDVWARRAKELGVALSIDSDAHSAEQLGFVVFGIATARRGWIEKRNVINALPLNQLLNRLQARARAA